MPVATYEQYCKMMDTAYANHYAFPAINVFDMESINGVLAGLAEAHSDGIIQMSFGGAQHVLLARTTFTLWRRNTTSLLRFIPTIARTTKLTLL